jgi:formylglycine-generating enzyme required for sulfatase activity
VAGTTVFNVHTITIMFIPSQELAADVYTIEITPSDLAGNRPSQPSQFQFTVMYEGEEAEMMLIPAGEFSMGDHHDVEDTDEKPVHTVYLDAYYMDIYEVTNDQYARFLNDYGKNTDDAGNELLDIGDEDCLIEKDGSTYRPKAGYEDHPVIEVSWYGAAAYAEFYGKRLPTEAEWEKAARGRLMGKRYPWGEDITHDDANYSGTGGEDKWNGTSPVGSFPPNGYGLYDVAGNVWEWCADWYDSGYYAALPRENPTGPISGSYRVLRGGSWDSSADPLRCANRSGFAPTNTNNNVGFRCAR